MEISPFPSCEIASAASHVSFLLWRSIDSGIETISANLGLSGIFLSVEHRCILQPLQNDMAVLKWKRAPMVKAMCFLLIWEDPHINLSVF